MTRAVIVRRVSLAAVVVGLAVLALTPVGVWFAGAVAVIAIGDGWRLDIGHHGGALASRALLGDLHLRHERHGVAVEIDEVLLTPWSWEVVLSSPRVSWTQPPESGAAPESGRRDTIRLPLANLPTIDVVAGSFRLPARGDGLRVDVENIIARLSPEGDGATMELALGLWSVTIDGSTITGDARSAWNLHTASVELREIFLRAGVGETQGTLRGRGTLDLAPTLDMSSALTLEGAASGIDSLRIDLVVEGSLAPLALSVTAGGEGAHSRLGPLTLHTGGWVDSATASADSFQVDISGGSVGGRASWQPLTGFDIAAHIDDLGLLPFGGLEGPVRGDVEVRGHPDNLGIIADLQAAVSGIAADPVDLTLHAELQDSHLRFRAASDRLGTLQATGSLALDRGSYDLDLTGELDANPWIGRSWPLSLRGRLWSDTLEVGLKTQRLPFGDDPPGPVQIDATLAAWRYLDVRFGVDRDQVLVRTRIDLQTAQLDTLTGSARGLSLSRLSRVVSGKLDGQLAASGELRQVGRGALALRVDDLGAAGWSLGPTTLVTRFLEGMASIDAEAPGLQLRGSIDTSGVVHVEAVMQDASVRRLGTDDSIRISGRLRVVAPSGDVAMGELHVDLDSARAELSGHTLNLPDGARGDYRNGHVRLSRTRLHTPLGIMQLQGDLRPDSVAIVVAIDSLETTGLEWITARGEARLQVGGRLDAPRAHLGLNLRSLELGGRPLGELTASLDLSDSLRGHLELGAASGDGSALTMSLSAPSADFHPHGETTGREQARVRIAARDLDASSIATYALDDSTGLTASLSADLRMPARQLLNGIQWRDISGYLELLELTVDRDRVRVRLEAPSRAQLSLGQASLQGFDLPVEMFRRDINTFESAGSIHIDGQLIGDSGGLTVRVDNLKLDAAARAIPGRVSLPAGEMSLQAHLTGTFDSLALDASADVELEFLGDLSACVSRRPRAWHGTATWVTLVEDSLQVTASAPAVNIWPKWDELTMRAYSAGIDLLPMLDQVPQLESLSGTLRLDVTVDSLVTDPHFAGQVEVEDLELALLDVKPGYHFPAGRIEFGERDGGGAHAQLMNFSGKTTSGPGKLLLTGFFDLLSEGGTDYRLQLVGKDVRYEYEDVFEAPDIDLDLTLLRDAQGSLLEGNVQLVRPTADVQLVDLTSPPVPPPPAIQSPFLESTRLNVYVDVDGLESRSELSNITLDGQTRVYGTFYQPKFQGELEIVDGQVIILNRQFTFTRGRIVLDRLVPTYSILDLLYDPILLDPELDLEATTTVQPYDESEPEAEVTMILEGPVREAAPRLTSPGLGDAEVLNLLAFGQTTTQNADYANALYTAAGQLLLSRRVQRVGLDEFLLLPSGTTLGTVGQSAVRVGKFLSWPLPIWVRYEAGTRAAAAGQFEVEYHITSWMTIDATAYSEYQLYGVGVGLSREF